MADKVIKVWVDKEKNISLFFTPNEKGLYVPSSNNDVLTNWLLNETSKPGKIVPVKRAAIVHVVNAAKDRLNNPEKVKEKQTQQQNRNDKLWDDNPIAALQEYFQNSAHRVLGADGQPIVPKYQTVDVMQGRGEQTVTIALILPNGETKYASASSAQEAKRIAAMDYKREVIDGKSKDSSSKQNATSQETKTSAPCGYYQLGDVFSVDGKGRVHKLPKTEYQIFLGPDLWMGRVGKKFTVYSHEEPIASFEWGKSRIVGGGTFNEEKFYLYQPHHAEIEKIAFINVIMAEMATQDDKASYALYRGKPGTPLEEARRYSFMRPATVDEFIDTVDGFLEYYQLDDKIKEAEKRTYGTHGGNRDMLEGKVLDLEREQLDLDDKILDNKRLFIRPNKKEKFNPMAYALQEAMKNKK